MGQFENRRILVIDDEPTMHQSFRSVLAQSVLAQANAQFDSLEATMFGDPSRPAKTAFTVASANQGREGLEIARGALTDEQPFAVAFVDMRMPPGWDGLQTVKELWSLDPRLQIVFCTAYSPYSWDEALWQLEVHDNLLVVKKPFDPIEVWQAASTLTAKWALGRQAEATKEMLDRKLDECARLLQERSPPASGA